MSIQKFRMRDLWAKFTSRIFLCNPLNDLSDSRIKKLIDVMLFVFMCLSYVIDWLDIRVVQSWELFAA
jgi:hypothetical protein